MSIIKNIVAKFTMKEVFMSNSAEQYSRALRVLKKNNIHFRTKSTNSGTQNRSTGMIMGQIGENTSLQILYYIYVAAADEQKSKNLIRNI